MARNLNIEHRGYRIVAALIGGKPAAQVYVGKALATRERFEGKSVEAAADAARVWVDTMRAECIERRRSPAVGTADEYVAFFSANPPTDYHRAMLVASLAAPDRILSAERPAKATA